jgi:hypothetical protein
MVLRQTEGKTEAGFFPCGKTRFFRGNDAAAPGPSKTAAAMVLRKSSREFATQR